MAYTTLIVETGANFVGTITLNRPDQLNTFTTPLALDLRTGVLVDQIAFVEQHQIRDRQLLFAGTRRFDNLEKPRCVY